MKRLAPCVLLLAALAGCGGFPRPFQGNPGATALRLARPPPPRLSVTPPPNALLSDEASRSFADVLAAKLRDQEVPAEPNAHPGDWRLIATAEERAGVVTPTYTVLNPKGEPQGRAQGAPIPARAWARADPATLNQVADAAAPAVANLLTNIEAAVQQADPNSLRNRPAKVTVANVTGAPGDGNFSLTRQMKQHLAQQGPIVQDTMDGADFVVRGEVRVVPVAGRAERVEIQWIVIDANKQERARVVQINEVPDGALDGYWGDVAAVVATEAAGGVKDVILQQTHRGTPEPKPAAAGRSSSAPPS
jgi:hypothetical protein